MTPRLLPSRSAPQPLALPPLLHDSYYWQYYVVLAALVLEQCRTSIGMNTQLPRQQLQTTVVQHQHTATKQPKENKDLAASARDSDSREYQ